MADMITVRRCMTCSVALPVPVELPDMGLRLPLACGGCRSILDGCGEDMEYRDSRDCTCGHALDDHKYVSYDTGEPPPCDAGSLCEEECGCRNFQEAGR